MVRNTITTVWELRTYDVWGNPEDGFEVNQTYGRGTVELEATLETHNKGTEHEFKSAALSLEDICEALDWNLEDVRIADYGDDIFYYLEQESDGMPLGELYCESHSSLSPPRLREDYAADFAEKGMP